MMYGWGFGNPFWIGRFFMVIPMLLFWALIIGGIAYTVRLIGAGNWATTSSRAGSKAIEILEERYARGEIDAEEFQARKRELQASRQ